MSVLNQLNHELKQLTGFQSAQPTTVTLAAKGKIEINIDFTSVDSMSCSFQEIRVNVPSLSQSTYDKLKEWGQKLCQRITYLLENIGPLEYDEDAGQVLIRSTPPDQNQAGTQFYEIILSSHANGNFSLKRFASQPGQGGRTQVDLQVTHEVLRKLVDDLVDTVP
ncbi:hypothetical protein [Gimesia fumaroli]|jgi:CxxC motif-containing protein (DUF1111 family)|uniref:Uncharacterized protein n=1 Tax=Gimesia fumaroli TaxID=2527976 RepID=A0A518IH53_9PLAN|nr:hypothetical protein [Gimesia fumaroli]QDV52414.1 hypothetical protein Enr17x_44760 [Gimesia fumaroli]